MPEGDALRRAARRLQPLVGERVEVETPHPRAAVKRIAERLDGSGSSRVEAVGKNLLLRFEGGVVLRSHLRMTGAGACSSRAARRASGGRGSSSAGRVRGVLWNGPVLELGTTVPRGSGPTSSPSRSTLDAIVANLRAADQRASSARRSSTSGSSPGSGTCGRPRRSGRGSRRGRAGEVSDDELRAAVEAAHG